MVVVLQTGYHRLNLLILSALKQHLKYSEFLEIQKNSDIDAANVNWRVMIDEHLLGSGTAGAAS